MLLISNGQRPEARFHRCGGITRSGFGQPLLLTPIGSRLVTVCLCQRGHRLESEITVRHRFRRHGGAEPLLPRPAVDVTAGEPRAVRRGVVVEHALGGVQDPRWIYPQRRELLYHVAEVPVARFVGSDVLGREDPVKDDPELFVAPREAIIVHIAQHEKAVVLLQIPQSWSGIAKRGPLPHRLAVPHALPPIDRQPPLLGQAAIHYRQQIAVPRSGGDALLCRFVAGMRFEHFVPTRLGLEPSRQRAQRFNNAGLPVNERPVYIEGKGLKVSEPQLPILS